MTWFSFENMERPILHEMSLRFFEWTRIVCFFFTVFHQTSLRLCDAVPFYLTHTNAHLLDFHLT